MTESPPHQALENVRFGFETDIQPPLADPEKAARRLLEHAHAFKPSQDGRIYIEKLNGPFLYADRGSPAEYSAGLKLAIEQGWLEIRDSGTYVKFTAAGADLFA